jgi:ankyrin repeat protein
MQERIASLTVATRISLWCLILSSFAAMVWLVSVEPDSALGRAGLSPDQRFDELLYAVIEGDVAQVQEALAGGADLNRRGFRGCTALGCAARSSRPGALQIARLLIQRGAHVDLADDNGATPLMFAVSFGNPDIAAALIQGRANVNARDVGGATPLSVALDRHDPTMIRLIRGGGAPE